MDFVCWQVVVVVIENNLSVTLGVPPPMPLHRVCARWTFREAVLFGLVMFQNHGFHTPALHSKVDGCR